MMEKNGGRWHGQKQIMTTFPAGWSLPNGVFFKAESIRLTICKLPRYSQRLNRGALIPTTTEGIRLL